MDRMIYVGMTGAKQALEQQAAVANNMANVSTPGFRAQINNFRAVPVVGEETATRAMVVATTPGADMRAGPLTQTGRALDVAVRGDGWLTVQMPDGSEAFTRVGNLQIGADGQLLTMDSRPVVGEAGPLVVPPGSSLVIADDGVVTAMGAGDPVVGGAPETGQPAGRGPGARRRRTFPDAHRGCGGASRPRNARIDWRAGGQQCQSGRGHG